MQISRLHACTGHRAAIYALAPGRDARHFLTAGGDGWVVEWDLGNLETGKLVANTETQLFSLCALPDPNRLVAGNMNGGIHWIVRDRPEQTRNVQHHKKGVYDLFPMGEWLFSAGGDGILTRWESDNARSVESIQLSNQALRSISYAASAHELAIGSSDHNIYFLDAETLALKKTLKNAHLNSVFTVAFHPGENTLLSGGRDAWLRAWALMDEPATHPLTPADPAHLYTINHIAFSPDGAFFATASRDKTIKIWDATTFQLLKVVNTMRYGGHINSVNRLLWLEDCLISASDDKSAMVWRVEMYARHPRG